MALNLLDIGGAAAGAAVNQRALEEAKKKQKVEALMKMLVAGYRPHDPKFKRTQTAGEYTGEVPQVRGPRQMQGVGVEGPRFGGRPQFGARPEAGPQIGPRPLPRAEETAPIPGASRGYGLGAGRIGAEDRGEIDLPMPPRGGGELESPEMLPLPDDVIDFPGIVEGQKYWKRRYDPKDAKTKQDMVKSEKELELKIEKHKADMKKMGRDATQDATKIPVSITQMEARKGNILENIINLKNYNLLTPEKEQEFMKSIEEIDYQIGTLRKMQGREPAGGKKFEWADN